MTKQLVAKMKGILFAHSAKRLSFLKGTQLK